MSILIVLRGRSATHPILVAANRDERLDRKAAPPGLWVGQQRLLLSPRDRVAGGTWLAIRDHGWFAGITNVAYAPLPKDAATRGDLPHLALDAGDLDAGERAVAAAIATRRYGGFQLVIASPTQMIVLRYDGTHLQRIDWHDELLLISNDHAPGQLTLRGLEQALAGAAVDAEAQLERLRTLLLDGGFFGGHAVLNKGLGYGTVSSSLIAVPASAPHALIWRYAAGAPDQTPYQNYGNLMRRLREESTLPSDRKPQG